MRFESFINV